MRNGEPDNWLFLVELLVLLVILSGIEGTLEIAMERVRAGLLSLGFGTTEASQERGYARMSQGGERERERAGWEWKSVLARVVVVSAVGGISLTVSGGATGAGAVNVAEVVGAIGFSLIGFLAPCQFLPLPSISQTDSKKSSSDILHLPIPSSSSPINLHHRSNLTDIR